MSKKSDIGEIFLIMTRLQVWPGKSAFISWAVLPIASVAAHVCLLLNTCWYKNGFSNTSICFFIFLLWFLHYSSYKAILIHQKHLPKDNIYSFLIYFLKDTSFIFLLFFFYLLISFMIFIVSSLIFWTGWTPFLYFFFNKHLDNYAKMIGLDFRKVPLLFSVFTLYSILGTYYFLFHSFLFFRLLKESPCFLSVLFRRPNFQKKFFHVINFCNLLLNMIFFTYFFLDKKIFYKSQNLLFDYDQCDFLLPSYKFFFFWFTPKIILLYLNIIMLHQDVYFQNERFLSAPPGMRNNKLSQCKSV